MAKLSAWFSILRWAIILTLILIIILTLSPIILPKHFDKDMKVNLQYKIHCAVTICLASLGLFCVCCYFFYLTLIFASLSLLYLIAEIGLSVGNIGTYLTWIGIVTCSYTFCAVMRRLRNEALYG